MISEMYTTSFGGGRSRGSSYTNIHGHHPHSGRCHFGSSRAFSLDQYNSRRLSDGVQAIVSDENTIFYNRQHRSLDNEVIGSNMMSDKFLSTDSCAAAAGSGAVAIDSSTEQLAAGGNNAMKTCCGGGSEKQQSSKLQKNQIQPKNNNGGSGGAAATRSFMSTLRHLKETFNFSFVEKDLKKRVAAAGTNANTATTNTTTTTTTTTSPNVAAADSNKNINPGFCCGAAQKEDAAGGGGMMKPMVPTRNRACSLDVPVRMWYNCNNSSGIGGGISNGGSGDSRKSSHEDNNSNHTIMSGEHNKSDADGNRSDGTSI